MIETEYEKEITAVEIELKNEKYFLEVENIKEIYVPSENIVPIPLADKLIVGVIDVRGDIYSIVSLRHIIYSEDLDYNLSENSRILLLDFNNSNIALLVDSVFGVKKIPISVFNEKKAIIKTNIDYGLIKQIGNFREQPIILLDLDALIQSSIAHLEKRTFRTSDTMPKVLIQPEIRPKIAVLSQESVGSDLGVKSKAQGKKKTKLSVSEEKIVLTLKQQDLLKEIGNIGCGNAVTALSKLIKQKIDVNLTDVGIISSDKLTEQFGGPKKKVCGIFCHIKAPSQSTILNVFEMKPLLNLVVTLAGKESQIDPNKVKSKEDLDKFAVSTIVEMGNIMAGHYASALADLLGTKIMIDVPEFAMTDAGLLGQFLSDEMKSLSKYIVLIKTSIKISDSKMSGTFFFIPDLEALDTLFQKLGIKFEKEAKRKKAPEETSDFDINKFQLSERQRDALQEVGNIGAGNAANALAQMINKRVDINIPFVEMIELDKYANKISKKNEKLLVAWSNVIGKTRATVLSIFNIKDIIDLTSIIVEDMDKKKIDERKKIEKVSDFPDLYRSAINELGHILASHYTSAIGDLLGIKLMTEVPDMSIDVGKQLFSILKEEIGLLKKLSLVITTNIIITDFQITGTFLFIPSLETLQNLLDALLNFYK